MKFLQHISCIDQAIKFTDEDMWPDDSMPFLDNIITPEAKRALSIGVYRKPTHTDLYLQWDSQLHVAAKYSVINTLSLFYTGIA